MLIGISKDIIPVILPDSGIRRKGVHFAIITVHPFLLQIVVEILELYFLVRLNAFLDGLHVDEDHTVLGLNVF